MENHRFTNINCSENSQLNQEASGTDSRCCKGTVVRSTLLHSRYLQLSLEETTPSWLLRPGIIGSMIVSKSSNQALSPQTLLGSKCVSCPQPQLLSSRCDGWIGGYSDLRTNQGVCPQKDAALITPALWCPCFLIPLAFTFYDIGTLFQLCVISSYPSELEFFS